ncbi:hypothetical protein ACTJJ0_23835 [Chitinophaga sp. 22321]|uniref:Uncharacterized protein n=1 Tax=Chitinophaga hostae TaxID=2831022 RepID=A0ABS5J4Z6_9BACT|nr:hypothetical protein [Chitinophaga hostae]MBS0030293.1 hypothetical protein [Chitinophaga hostae]
MNYEIVELENLSGSQATIYSVIMENDEVTLFDHFILENSATNRDEVKFILGRLLEIGENTGARDIFFKHNEGKPGDGVCALYDLPDSQLRLYCIRYGNSAVLLGGGGPKSRKIRSWQEDLKLSREATNMIRISKDILERMLDGEIRWSGDGMQLLGNLIFSNDDEA